MPTPTPRIEAAKTLRRVPSAGLSLALAATSIGAVVSGCGGEEEESEGLCTSTEQFFAEKVWAPTVSTICIGCHNPTGQAKDTSYVLHASSEAGYLEANTRWLWVGYHGLTIVFLYFAVVYAMAALR